MGNMAADQRQDAIRRMLADNPAATQQQLAAELGVDQRTVSRDIAKLRQAGAIGMPNPSGRGRPPGSVTALQVVEAPTPGEELVVAIRAEMAENGLEPDSREEGLLASAARSRNRIAELEAAITADGLRHTGKDGRVSLHPAVSAIAQAEGVLARALSHIQPAPTVRNPVKQRAAQSRWRQHNIAKAARYDGADGGA